MHRCIRVCLALPLVLFACHGSASVDAGSDEQTKHDAGPADAGHEVDAGHEPDAGPAEDAGLDAGAAACDFTVSYPLHYPCNRNADCMSGHCAFALDTATGEPVPGICTDRCPQGDDSACPTGYTCDFGQDDTTFGTFCLPMGATALPPGNGTLGFGSPCAQSADCAGDGTQCGVVDDSDTFTTYTFCSPTCSVNDPMACNGCGTCEDVFMGETTTCLPRGPGPIGAPCTTRTDCQSFVCATFCSDLCSSSMPCPNGAACVDDGNMQDICVAPSQVGAVADGEACVFNFQCVPGDTCLVNASGQSVCTKVSVYGESCQTSALCADDLSCIPLDQNAAVCTIPCSASCGVGSACVAPQIDTVLSLYSEASGQQQIAQSDNGPNSVWSTFQYNVEPGTYWVEVTSNNLFLNGYLLEYTGGYTLSILDGTQTPAQVTELPQDPTGNQSIATAQLLPQVPVIVAGSLQPVASTFTPATDFYQFKIGQPMSLTFSTGPGPGSFCAPIGRSTGEPCWDDVNCSSSLCETTLGTCTTPCSTDSDCGSGEHCVPDATGLICAAGSQYGSIAAGQPCSFDWQCVGGIACVAYGSNQVCAALCGSGQPSCNAAVDECAAATDSSGSTSEQACVPLGNRMGAFGSTCVLQSDCVSGLECTDGVCSATCTTTAQCPNQSLIPPTGDTSTDVCRSCQTDADCSEGLCIEGIGYERFCGDPCSTNGTCSAGFLCVEAVSGAGTGCAPQDGSCRPPVCQMGACVLPSAGFAEACVQSSDCSTGTCTDSLCTHTCQTNGDCDCPTGDLTCQSGSCGWNNSYIATQQPDGGTQSLSGSGPWTIQGELPAAADGFTSLMYSFSANAGATINIAMTPVCGFGSPGLSAALELTDPSGSVLGSDAPVQGYPQIASLSADVTGMYRLDVLQLSSSQVPGAFVLSISAQ